MSSQPTDSLWLVNFLIKHESTKHCAQGIEAILAPYSERMANRFHFYSINAGLTSSCEVVLGAFALQNKHLSEQDITKINAILLWDKEYRRDYESAHLSYKINDPSSYTGRSSLDKMDQIKAKLSTAMNILLNPTTQNETEKEEQ
jgi:hypothetical protein